MCKHTKDPQKIQSSRDGCSSYFVEGKWNVYTADIFKCKVYYKCNPDIILIQNRLFLDLKGHWETAGRKWRGSVGPWWLCIWWKESLPQDQEEKVCLSVSKEEDLLKSRPILDRRSPHSITSYQPHITHLIYLSLPSYSSFLIASDVPSLLLIFCFALLPFFHSFSSPTLLQTASELNCLKKWKVQVACVLYILVVTANKKKTWPFVSSLKQWWHCSRKQNYCWLKLKKWRPPDNQLRNFAVG